MCNLDVIRIEERVSKERSLLERVGDFDLNSTQFTELCTHTSDVISWNLLNRIHSSSSRNGNNHWAQKHTTANHFGKKVSSATPQKKTFLYFVIEPSTICTLYLQMRTELLIALSTSFFTSYKDEKYTSFKSDFASWRRVSLFIVTWQNIHNVT